MNKCYGRFSDSPRLQALVLSGIYLISRFPKLFNGYGVEEDSWSLVLTAFRMREDQTFYFSRMPGHPFHELFLAFSPVTSPFVFNGFTALFGLAAVLLLFFILRNYGFRYSFAGALLMAFVPVFYIASTYTIDYVWALAFVLGAWLSLKKEKFLLAGLLLGLAVSCRIFAGVMAIPFIIMLWDGNLKSWVTKCFKIGMVSLVTTVIMFYPVWHTYGWEFFGTYSLPYPLIPKAIYKGSFGVFGFLGLIGLLAAIVMILRQKHTGFKGGLFSQIIPSKELLAWGVGAVLYLAKYWMLPEKSAFLIPLIPFLVLFLGYLSQRSSVIFLATGFMVLSPFIAGFDLTDPYRGAERSRISITRTIAGQEVFFDLLRGPVVNDYSKRRQKEAFVEKVINAQDNVPKGSYVISEFWYNQIKVNFRKGLYEQRLEFVPHAPPEKLKSLREKGVNIYYLPEIDYFNDRRYGQTFTGKYATPYPLD